MSDLELSRLKNAYEMALHEVQQLREWKRRRENDEAREEGMGNRGRVVRRQREDEDDGKDLLSSEREKSAGFFC
jgi:hypothetical protein